MYFVVIGDKTMKTNVHMNVRGSCTHPTTVHLTTEPCHGPDRGKQGSAQAICGAKDVQYVYGACNSLFPCVHPVDTNVHKNKDYRLAWS